MVIVGVRLVKSTRLNLLLKDKEKLSEPLDILKAVTLSMLQVTTEHFITGQEGADAAAMGRIWLFVIAITIHNFPEGMSIGVAFGDGTTSGISVMTGISLQDMPEGLAVAVALIGRGYSRWKSFLVAALTGMVEPIGALIGASAVSVTHEILPLGLTFSAGAMLYIISHEILPETHRNGHQNRATTGLLFGLILMMILDVTLG